MRLSFNSKQSYQLEAIKAITDVFEGQPLNAGSLQFSISNTGSLISENGFSNELRISEEQILKNVASIQERNNIADKISKLDGMNFSVEMETGTGKTYVYLRTVYELNKLYGFTKFIIVVPSIAIKEGVVKNLEITHSHFQSIYDNQAANFDVYDSKKVSKLRPFATNNCIQILVINIDSFAKDENVINKPNDKLTGKKPIEFIQSTNPIVIVDEPQNMETVTRKNAINNLNPLCTLRYSATHTNIYNLVYSLNPVKAYDLGLVKQIEVDSVFADSAVNEAFIELETIKAGKKKISAKIKLDINNYNGVARKSISVNSGDDLYDLSNNRGQYEGGFIVDDIDAANQTISFTNGTVLSVGETKGGKTDEIMRFQIKKTIEEHLKKEKQLAPKGIKVLSLFFIDKVKNYRNYETDKNGEKGKFALWFEEILRKELEKPGYKDLYPFTVEDLHNGYFSRDSKGKFKDTGGETSADDDTYKLIMQKKEELLDMQTPLRFIFSHSALREGWDNPNVFQICTLNETKSEIKKRQEIGRGLRLCVNQDGERIFDKSINRLTIIANETYEDFAKALQHEIEEDCGVSFEGRIKNKGDKRKVEFRKGFTADPKFLQIWEKIKHHTKYSVDYNTEELIQKAAKAVKDMPDILKPSIKSLKSRINITEEGVTTSLVGQSNPDVDEVRNNYPDLLYYIQSRTELTRKTILNILIESGRISDFFKNPQLFMDFCVSAIKDALHELMIDGIKYHRIGDSFYEMQLFSDTELEIYLDNFTHSVSNPDKTIVESYMPLDSMVENQFAKDCETSDNVEFYFKLPNWFKIRTPIGTYNPDWAVVFSGEKKIYFVAETKGKGQELLKSELLKIKCGKAHFDEFSDVVYKQVTQVSELNT